MNNPYTARAMIKDPDAFFGRHRVVANILQNLNGFMCTSIVGERRSGKSSLLWHLCQPETHATLRLLRGASGSVPPLFVYFDLQRVAALSEKAFFRMVGREIAARLPAESVPNEAEFDEPQEYFDALVRGAAKQFGIILCLDEFEVICNDEKFDSNFLQPLRNLANESMVAYVTASRTPLKPLISETAHTRGSQFWNIFAEPPFYLGLFTREESMEVLTKPPARNGQEFSTEEQAFLLELAGDHPLFLQIACYCGFQLKLEKADGGAQGPWCELERKRIRDQFTEAAKPHFEYLWEHLTTTERKIVSDGSSQDDDSRAAARALLLKGVVTESLAPFASTFAEYARANRQQERGIALVAAAPGGPPQIPVPPGPRPQGVPPQGLLTEEARPKEAVTEMEICLGRNKKILITVRGPFNQSFFCANDATWEDFGYLASIGNRARKLARSETWRQEKQELGKSVKDLFNNPTLAETYTSCLGSVRNNEQLRLIFRCPKEMLSFPFELINSLSTIQDGPSHIALMHPIRKSILNVRWARKPLDPEFFRNSRGKVLLVSSNVSGTLRLGGKQYQVPPIPNAPREVEAVAKLFAAAKERGHTQLCVDTCPPNPTADEFSRLIRTGDYEIVHYSGHGFYADSPEQSCLLFSSGDGIEAVPAAQLNTMVEQTGIRFVYLSCCDAANTGAPEMLLTNDFLGIADALIAAGIPSLLAMRWPLGDNAGYELAATFYRELLGGQDVEVALLRARRHLQNRDPNDRNWLSPVLVVQ